jgi:hypothetical protein
MCQAEGEWPKAEVKSELVPMFSLAYGLWPMAD